MPPQQVFDRLNGLEVDGAGSWTARCDIETEAACWLLRCDGKRLTIETIPLLPEMDRPPAEMCIWYKSARLFMRDARGQLNEHAFAAEYVKGSIIMEGDREKAQELAAVFKCGGAPAGPLAPAPARACP